MFPAAWFTQTVTIPSHQEGWGFWTERPWIQTRIFRQLGVFISVGANFSPFTDCWMRMVDCSLWFLHSRIFVICSKFSLLCCCLRLPILQSLVFLLFPFFNWISLWPCTGIITRAPCWRLGTNTKPTDKNNMISKTLWSTSFAQCTVSDAKACLSFRFSEDKKTWVRKNPWSKQRSIVRALEQRPKKQRIKQQPRLNLHSEGGKKLDIRDSRCANHKEWSHRHEGPYHCFKSTVYHDPRISLWMLGGKRKTEA